MVSVCLSKALFLFICSVIMQTSSTHPVGSVISSFHSSEGESALSLLHYRGGWRLVVFCQTADLGLRLEVDFVLLSNSNMVEHGCEVIQVK